MADPAVAEPSADVLVAHHDGWSEVRLKRTRRRNALSSAFVDHVLDAFAGVARHGHEVALLSAEGPVFCAGGDTSESWRPSEAPGTRLIDAFSRLEISVVSLVEGPALGAAVALVACSPITVASTDAWFSLPEVSLGYFPGGPLPFVEAVIASRRAFVLGLSAERLTAVEAAAIGLVTETVDAASTRDVALAYVDRLVGAPKQARQARRYWQERFLSEEFRGRRRWALSMIEEDLS